MLKGKLKRGAVAVAAFVIAAGLFVPAGAAAQTHSPDAVSETVGAAGAELPQMSPVILESEDDTAEEEIEELESGDGVVMFAEGQETASGGNPGTVKLSYSKIVRHEDWFTRIFSVEYDGEERTAYCIEPKEYPPEEGQQQSLSYDNDIMTKALYYSYGYPGYDAVTKGYLAKKSKAECYEGDNGAYILSHIMLSYLYDKEDQDSDAFKGISKDTQKLIVNMIKELKVKWPAVPDDASLELDNTDIAAEWDSEKQVQETPVVKLKGHTDNRIVFNVPENTVVTKLSGQELSDHESGTVELHGGDEFYVTAAADKQGIYESGELHGSLQEFQPYIIQVTDKQDIMYSGRGNKDSVSFRIMWENIGLLKLKKVSAVPEITEGNDNYSLEGAVYEIYDQDGNSEGKITTDTAGNAESLLPYGNYSLKEISAPEGYLRDEESYDVVIVEEEVMFEHEEEIIPEAPLPDSTPQTGDDLPQGILIAIAAASIAVMTLLVTTVSVRGKE